jgi:predicted ferric reductase
MMRRAPRGRLARRDATVRALAGGLLWSVLLLVTYWWVVAGGVLALTSTAGALTSLGQLTGLLASALMLTQIVLIARVPLLERAFGQDRLLVIHRVVGFTSFSLMLAHVGLITWGYAAGQLSSVPGTFWQLTRDYPGMLLALAGTTSLLISVLTSLAFARARMRYESWHLLHLYAYLGVTLALPHQLWTGKSFTSSPGATVFWWVLWGAAVAAVLIWRVGLPLLRNLRHQLHVTSVVAEPDGSTSVYLSGRAVHRLRADAGQFFVWRFLGREGWTRAHPYSLSAAPNHQGLRLTVKPLGAGSREVASLRPGTRVAFEGPYGRLGERRRTQHKLAFIGAGVGVAPLRSLAEGMSYAPGDAVFVQRFTDVPLFPHELDELARTRGLQMVWLPGRRRAANSWVGRGAEGSTDAAALHFWVPDLAERDVYICGPSQWAELVRASAERLGTPDDQIHVENFRW